MPTAARCSPISHNSRKKECRERSRPFPVFLREVMRGIPRKILRATVVIPARRCHPERSEGSCAGDHIGSPLRQIIKPPKEICHTKKQAVGNGLDRSAGTMSCHVGDNPTTERSRPFPTYSIWGGCKYRHVGDNPATERSRPFPTYSIEGVREILRKILSATVVIPARRCHPERSEGSCAGDHIAFAPTSNY